MERKLSLVATLFLCMPVYGKEKPFSSCEKMSGAGVFTTVIITGELTRKGSDVNSWWALREASGRVYRLELFETTLEKSLFAWQNQSVTVVGELAGRFLSTDLICVREARLTKGNRS